MDDRGYWHKSNEDEFGRKLREAMAPSQRERPVIEIGIGEMVAVIKADGSRVMATFTDADKNKVTLTPQDDGKPRPYLDLAESVWLERATGESVRAQVWDNRRGKLILRTLPL